MGEEGKEPLSEIVARWEQDDIDPVMLDEDDDEEWFDCHMGPGGHCGAAGSEWCEFECPHRRRQRLPSPNSHSAKEGER